MARMRVEIYFDFSCPYAYIASTRIEDVCARAGAELVWRPMLLGGVFRALEGATGDGPMARMGPAKARHNRLDFQRWAEHWDVPLTLPAAHPMRTVRALRVLLAVPETCWPAAIHALYRAYWQQGRDMTAPGTVAAALGEAGLDQATIARALAANDDAGIKDALRRRTDEAVARGVFGAPAMFVHVPGRSEPIMFWGQDRLHLVEAVLAGWRPESGQPPAALVGHAGTHDAGRPEPAGPAAAVLARRDNAPTVQFWYDFSSPFAYLGSTQIEDVCARADALLVWRPMLLGALFRDVGTENVPLLAMPPAKRAYIERDLHDWAAYRGVPFRFPSRFPMRTVTALRLALLAGARIASLSHALFHAYWAQDQDLDDPDTLARILRDQGFDAEAMLARTQDAAVKQQLFASTTEARDAGVFGAPTTIVEDARGDLLFWGQDRLELVEAALRSWRPREA